MQWVDTPASEFSRIKNYQKSQPDFVYQYCCGSSCYLHYELALDLGGAFCIVKHHSHSSYVDRFTGTKTCGVRWILVHKGENFWLYKGLSRDLIEGRRITQADRDDMLETLRMMERTHGVA